jgi:phosphatidylglycerophosphate synthase
VKWLPSKNAIVQLTVSFPPALATNEKPTMGYQPAWRRPIASIFRRTAGLSVQGCVRLGVHPNWISYSSVIASIAAGLCFYRAGATPALLIAAVAFCYVRLWLNMLDGMVALASGTASPSGEIANEFPDRVSDVIIFVGVAHSSLCHPLSGYWVAIFALVVAYVGTLGQAVGAQREFSGLMSKPWRMVALHIGAWITLGLLWGKDGAIRYGSLTVLDWTLLAIVLGCVQTIWVRLARILRALRAADGPPAVLERS